MSIQHVQDLQEQCDTAEAETQAMKDQLDISTETLRQHSGSVDATVVRDILNCYETGDDLTMQTIVDEACSKSAELRELLGASLLVQSEAASSTEEIPKAKRPRRVV